MLIAMFAAVSQARAASAQSAWIDVNGQLVPITSVSSGAANTGNSVSNGNTTNAAATQPNVLTSDPSNYGDIMAGPLVPSGFGLLLQGRDRCRCVAPRGIPDPNRSQLLSDSHF